LFGRESGPGGAALLTTEAPQGSPEGNLLLRACLFAQHCLTGLWKTLVAFWRLSPSLRPSSTSGWP